MPYPLQDLPYLIGLKLRTVRWLVWTAYAIVFVALVNPAAAAGWNGAYTGSNLALDGVQSGDLGAVKAEAYGPSRPPSVKEVLIDVCRERGYGDDCAKSLLGMAWKESQFEAKAIGDHGRAVGFFQIHVIQHQVSRACAQDLRCSAGWTLSYMESNGYPKYPRYAIQCHNGCNVANGYAASVVRNGQRLWDEMSSAMAPVAMTAKTVALSK